MKQNDRRNREYYTLHSLPPDLLPLFFFPTFCTKQQRKKTACHKVHRKGGGKGERV